MRVLPLLSHEGTEVLHPIYTDTNGFRNWSRHITDECEWIQELNLCLQF